MDRISVDVIVARAEINASELNTPYLAKLKSKTRLPHLLDRLIVHFR
jgi:hypothetical protein